MSFEFACGCQADEVGQLFERGILVCPEHRVPVAVDTSRPAQPWRGKATLELDLEAVDHEEAVLVLDTISSVILGHDQVRAIVSSLQEAVA